MSYNIIRNFGELYLKSVNIYDIIKQGEKDVQKKNI